MSVRLALYGAASLALKVVRSLQLLLEINKLRKQGAGSQFALCLRLELLKLVLKMILYALTPFAFYCDEQSIAQALEAHKEKQVPECPYLARHDQEVAEMWETYQHVAYMSLLCLSLPFVHPADGGRS